MSSFGAGGGSATAPTADTTKNIMNGLGVDKLVASIGQQFQQGQQGAPVQPGQSGRMSPQQRLASVMQMYSGNQTG